MKMGTFESLHDRARGLDEPGHAGVLRPAVGEHVWGIGAVVGGRGGGVGLRCAGKTKARSPQGRRAHRERRSDGGSAIGRGLPQ